jgi:2-polyprenyl-6-hydroxyphenyl methylase/3-demethylubiquinone-9 3-methyltransferase
VGVPPESIQVGLCHLTWNGQVARVVKILPDGRARYQFHSSAVARASGWYEATTDLRSFRHLVEREIPSDWTPDLDQWKPPRMPRSDLPHRMGKGCLLDQIASGTIDQAQIDHFDGDEGGRWGEDGPARWLHRYNAVRVPYIQNAACAAAGRNPENPQPLAGLRILDIGCGAGILCEPLAQLGASVVGIDLAKNTIHTASARAWEMGLAVEYRCEPAEALADAGECFDVVIAMEVIEHVADYPLFLKTCASLAAPGGVVILSTINRTLKSWVQAIVIGEYLLGLLPRGAHQWSRFVSPDEIRTQLARNGMSVTDVSGVTMNLRTRQMQLSRKTGVNYMLTAHCAGKARSARK